MDEKELAERLARYFAGECSEEEVERLHEWIAREPGAAERMARLQRIWEAAEAPASSWDAEAAWEDLHRRVRENATSTSESDRPGSDRFSRDASTTRSRRTARRPSRSGGDHLARMAALTLAVLAVALVGALATDSVSLWSAESEAKVFTTNKGEQSTVRLPDGTRAHLNVDSRLTIPAAFGDRREVLLKGEAYFEVAKDSNRSFIVRTGEASVQVLGTAFNVRSYTDAQETRVAVEEGKVALYTGSLADHDTAAVLFPHSLALASDRGLDAVREDVDLSRELAWTEKRLVFQDAPFEEIVQKLERWYDVQVEVEPSTGEIVRLNATFEDVSLQDVLQDVSAALNLEYRKNGDRVVFYR